MMPKKQPAFINFLDNLGQNFQFQDVQHWAKKEFAIKQIKSFGISMKQCQSCYQSIKNKYFSNLIGQWPDQWHKNQKKIFIQILLCYCKSKHRNPITMKIEEWEYLSSIVFNKNPLFLKFHSFQFLNLQKITQWNNQHDELIQEFIQKCGQGNWSNISKMIFYKNKCQHFFPAKQIRQRWNNHIRKCLNKGPWSNQEDRALLQHVLIEGKRWSQITQLFQKTRTQHMIKNRYNFLMKKYDKNRLSKSPQVMKLIKEIKQKQKKSRRTQKSAYDKRIGKKSLLIRSQEPQQKIQITKQSIQKQIYIPQQQNKNVTVQSIENFELQNEQMLKKNQIMLIAIFNQCGFNQNIYSTQLIHSYIPVYQASLAYNNLNLFDTQQLQFWQLVLASNTGIIDNQCNN